MSSKKILSITIDIFFLSCVIEKDYVHGIVNNFNYLKIFQFLHFSQGYAMLNFLHSIALSLALQDTN